MQGWMISTMGQIGGDVHRGGRETECVDEGGASDELRRICVAQ